MRNTARQSLNISIVWILLFGLFTVADAQKLNPHQSQKRNWERRQLRMAQNYQRRNEHEKAIRILEGLYKAVPGNLQYYQELLESYLHLSLIDRAENLIRRQQETDPGNPRYRIDYGQVLLKSGDTRKALQLWEEILQRHPDDVALYILVAKALSTNRMYDEAIKIYKQAYQQHPDKPFLLRELADFYRSRLQYKEALRYYVEFLRKKPENFQPIVRIVLSFRLEDEQEIETLIDLMREELERSEDVIPIRILAAKVFQKFRRYEEALSIYQQLETAKSRGRYLMDFARAIQSDSLYALALRAYMDVIDRFPQSPFLWQAYQGAARCNLRLAQQQNDQSYARQAIDIIQQVRERFPNRVQIAELRILEGDIYREFFFDLDRAISAYTEVAERYKKITDIRDRALLNAGESYIMRGDLNKAWQVLQEVHSKDRKPGALYLLAKIEFYRGNYESAGNLLNQIIELQGLSGNVANDAIDLLGLLAHEEVAAQALQLYAEADWLLMQQQKSQAISKLQKALEADPPPPLKIRMLMQAARLSADIGKPEEALTYCNRVLKDESLHLYADEALFLMASIMENQIKDIARAFALYDQLLVEFPNSQFAIAARERLKQIRKQNPDVMP